jgi:prepilin-type N-terminal cleavage/methylation domain-containing protein
MATGGHKGFTLLELILVLALFAIVSSLVVPLAAAMLADANRAKAEADVQQLATAMTRFYADLRHFPACSADDCSRAYRTSETYGLAFLAVGEGRGDLSTLYPAESESLRVRWNLRLNADASRPARNNAFNHLVANNPNADGAVDANDYPGSGRRWLGPYVSGLGPDPWGQAYVVSVGAMEAGGRPVALAARPWILSAGPNGIIETAPDALTLGGDDVGLLLSDPAPAR